MNKQPMLLAVKENKKDINVRVKSLEEINQEQLFQGYLDFFKQNIKLLNLENSYQLEIANDQFLTVSDYYEDKRKCRIFTIDMLEELLEKPTKLAKVDLVHAVMPFDEALKLINGFSKVPEVTNARTTVILGAYGDKNDKYMLDYNKRVLAGLTNKLDFCEYVCEEDKDSYFKMIYSTYKKNIKMRH